MARVKEENGQLRYQKEVSERDYHGVMLENNSLISKLENLENIFVGAPIQKPATGGHSAVGGPHIGTEQYVSSKVHELFVNKIAGNREYGAETEDNQTGGREGEYKKRAL